MRIERDIINSFKRWKDSSDRKPILLKGARQIGKTWAMETFGRENFDYCVKFDFDRQPELKSVFQVTKSPDRLVKELELYCEQPIIPGRTLMIFDEIQECEEALNSLKYFCEDAPQYHIIAAGSLLGVAVKRRKMTVPVGKVTIMRMYPITFREFLRASDPSTFCYVDAIKEIGHLPEIIIPCKKIKNPDKFAKYYDEPSEFTFDQILNPNKEREIISSTPKNKFYSLNFNSNIYH